MSTPPPAGRRSAGDKKTPPSSSIITRNGARKAKIQTRAMSAGAKPSAVVVAAKKKAQMKKKPQGDTLARDYLQIAMDAKSLVKGPTGFVTEPRMAEHRCLWDEKYPESPQRLISVIERCEELGLTSQCMQFTPRAATKEELSVLHSPSIYELLETTHQNQNYEYLEEVSSRYDAIYIHPSTHELALVSAGSTIDMVERILSGEVQNGFAAVRPPGHHAMRAEPCGYCFYNNAALAAKRAVDAHGLTRVLIVDWDVHHGQATQQMFYDDPRVVYFSVHRYEHGAFWPNLKQSNFHYTGAGRGAGHTFNVPLNVTGCTDADYLAIWHQLLMPMALEYQPELIIVSAGYDAAVGCLEGEMLVSPSCYAALVHQLMCVQARVCVALEGGYCVRSLAEGAALTLRTLLGYPPPRIARVGEPCDSVRESILNCIYTHKKFWNCFNFQPTYSVDSSVPNVCDVKKDKHTVVVKWEGDETVPERYETRDCYPVQSEQVIRETMAILDQMIADTDLSIPKHPVCYVYDERMLKHQNIFNPDHVERPARIERIHERHAEYGLLGRVARGTSRLATSREILAVHTQEHFDRLSELSSTKLKALAKQTDAYDSVYLHPDSLESALTAAGCVLQMVDDVLTGVAGAGVCVIRPPGHHADAGTPSGFCLLNSAAAGAHRALTEHRLRRVLVLDWDAHHGNGTQRLTYDTDQILYISIHRYDNGTFFPASEEGDFTAVGAGQGEGYNVNVPWNKRGFGDAEYLAAMTQVVLPIAYEYSPQLVLVSAGFDAAHGDPLGGCKVTPECFARMTMMLRGLASGRVILCLEGGYNVNTISYCMTMCTKALLGDPIPCVYEPEAKCHPSAVESISNVIGVHKKYWKSLKFQVALPIEDVIEPPGPSRGLSITNEDLSSTDLQTSTEQMTSLELGMDNLSLNKDNVKGSDCQEDVHDSEVTESGSKSAGAGPSTNDKASKDLDAPGPSCGRPGRGFDEAGPSSQANNIEISTDQSQFWLSEELEAVYDGRAFAVVPAAWCPHIDELTDLPPGIRFEQGSKCFDCDLAIENWVCLHCYGVYCSRYQNEHLQAHYSACHHPLALSLSDLSAWCSACGLYLQHSALRPAVDNAYRCKFGEDAPMTRPQ